MVFRDYAQGAFRMRGIGKGQIIRESNTKMSSRHHANTVRWFRSLHRARNQTAYSQDTATYDGPG